MEISAEELFEEHLQRKERDEPADLAELCALHPALEPRLLELADGWERFSEQVDRLEQGLTPDLEALQSYPEYQRELQTLLDLWPGAGTRAEEWLRSRGGDASTGPGHGDRGEPPAGSAFRAGEGTVIGEFRLSRLLGRGGMGEVWLASQGSLARDVALKLILPERVSGKGLSLFAREARAGGRLAHPGIVSVYGAGEDAGLHWIAMELVAGGRDLRHVLDAGSEGGDLGVGDFETCARFVVGLADALEHAHAAGVIHRDVKPQNILITEDGAPKLTDFGLARIADETALSRTGDVAGTYLYMSPEQVSARRIGLDHRSDLFSLGVVLYEMLSLQRPFEGDTAHQVAAKILHHDPPDLRTIRSRVPRDLAVICGKALEKRPQDRYASAAELAADLRRFLSHEPIQAKPPTLAQRTGKWGRRHPARASALALTGVALAVISALLLAYRGKSIALEEANSSLTARGAELEDSRAALAAESESLREANAALSVERQHLERVSEFQASTLMGLDVQAIGEVITAGFVDRYRGALEQDPGLSEEQRQERIDRLRDQLEGVGPTNVAIDVLDEQVLARHAEAIDAEFAEDPATQGRLIRRLGDIYHWIGATDKGLEHLTRARDLLCSSLPVGHEERLRSHHDLATCMVQAYDLDGAEECLAELLSEADSGGVKEHAVALLGMKLLGDVQHYRGAFEEALETHRQFLEEQGRLLEEPDLSVFQTMMSMGASYYRLDRLDEAVNITREALEGIRAAFGEDEADGLTAASNLAVFLGEAGRFEEAVELARDTLRTTLRVRGDRSTDSHRARNNLGHALDRAGRGAEAIDMYRVALDGWRATLGESDPRTLTTQGNLANLYSKEGQHEEALGLLRHALETQRENIGPDHQVTLEAQEKFGAALFRAGRYAEAEAQLRDLVQRATATQGAASSLVGYGGRNLARALEAQGKTAQAREVHRLALQAMLVTYGASHPDTLGCWVDLLPALRGEGLEAEALEQAGAFGEALLASGLSGEPLRAMAEWMESYYRGLHEASPGEGHDLEAGRWSARLRGEDR